MNCIQCGQEMRLIPAGISKKTGKPYNAFYSCKLGHTRPAETSPNITKSPTSPVSTKYDTSQSSEEVKSLKEKIEAMSERMDKMAEWAKGVATKEDLVNLDNKFRTLLVDLRGEEAVELHTSMEAPKKFQFDLDTVKKQLTPDQDNEPLDIKVPDGLGDERLRDF